MSEYIIYCPHALGWHFGAVIGFSGKGISVALKVGVLLIKKKSNIVCWGYYTKISSKKIFCLTTEEKATNSYHKLSTPVSGLYTVGNLECHIHRPNFPYAALVAP